MLAPLGHGNQERLRHTWFNSMFSIGKMRQYLDRMMWVVLAALALQLQHNLNICHIPNYAANRHLEFAVIFKHTCWNQNRQKYKWLIDQLYNHIDISWERKLKTQIGAYKSSEPLSIWTNNQLTRPIMHTDSQA